MASAVRPDDATKRRALAEAAEWQAGEISAAESQRWQSLTVPLLSIPTVMPTMLANAK